MHDLRCKFCRISRCLSNIFIRSHAVWLCTFPLKIIFEKRKMTLLKISVNTSSGMSYGLLFSLVLGIYHKSRFWFINRISCSSVVFTGFNSVSAKVLWLLQYMSTQTTVVIMLITTAQNWAGNQAR